MAKSQRSNRKKKLRTQRAEKVTATWMVDAEAKREAAMQACLDAPPVPVVHYGILKGLTPADSTEQQQQQQPRGRSGAAAAAATAAGAGGGDAMAVDPAQQQARKARKGGRLQRGKAGAAAAAAAGGVRKKRKGSAAARVSREFTKKQRKHKRR